MADAGFSSTDSSGCVITAVFLEVSENSTLTPPGSPTVASRLLIGVSIFDLCAFTITSTVGMTDQVGLQFDADLNQATLNATLQLCFFPENCSDTSVQATWTGVGTPVRDVSPSHFRSGDTLYVSQLRGVSRTADAIASVVFEGTNLTPRPATFGSLALADSHTITVLTSAP